MIWRRLKKATKQDQQEFNQRLQEADLSWKDKFAMIVSAFFVIVLPCLLVLVALSLFVLWLFGVL